MSRPCGAGGRRQQPSRPCTSPALCPATPGRSGHRAAGHGTAPGAAGTGTSRLSCARSSSPLPQPKPGSGLWLCFTKAWPQQSWHHRGPAGVGGHSSRRRGVPSAQTTSTALSTGSSPSSCRRSQVPLQLHSSLLPASKSHFKLLPYPQSLQTQPLRLQNQEHMLSSGSCLRFLARCWDAQTPDPLLGPPVTVGSPYPRREPPNTL